MGGIHTFQDILGKTYIQDVDQDVLSEFQMSLLFKGMATNRLTLLLPVLQHITEMVIHITRGLKQELTNTYCIVIKVTPSAQGWCEWGTWAMVGMTLLW